MFDTSANTPASEIHRRIASLQTWMSGNDLDGALILQNIDLFYFAGTIQQSHLYVPSAGEPILMVRKSIERARSESALSRIVPISSPRRLPSLLKEQGYRLPAAIGMELDVLPANHYLDYREILPGTRIVDLSDAVRRIRSVKSAYEIAMIEEAARRADEVARCVPVHLHEGITEIELAGKIEAEARKRGHQGIVRMRMWGGELFYGHLMAGPSAAVPSYLASPTGGTAVSPAVAQGPGRRPIEKNEPVLVDYVFVHNGYIADHARIFSIGRLPEPLEKAHGCMLELQGILKQAATPGAMAGRLYAMALSHAEASGYGPYFMGADAERIRFVGHGVGLELDEPPFLAAGRETELAAGMVVALEPKLIFPGMGVVGIENTHVVTATGLRQLTVCEEQIVCL